MLVTTVVAVCLDDRKTMDCRGPDTGQSTRAVQEEIQATTFFLFERGTALQSDRNPSGSAGGILLHQHQRPCASSSSLPRSDTAQYNTFVRC